MLEVRLKRNGRIEIKVEGIPGESCMDADAFIRKLGTVEKDEKTDEFYQSEVSEETKIRHNG